MALVIVDGPDRVGKTLLCEELENQALAANLSASVKHHTRTVIDEVWRDFQTVIKRPNVMHIWDRRWPSEIVYSHVQQTVPTITVEDARMFESVVLEQIGDTQPVVGLIYTRKWEALTQEGRDDIWKDWRYKVLHIDSAREYYNALNDCYARYSEHSQLFDTLYIGESDHIQDSKDAASVVMSMLPKPPELTVAERITISFAKYINGKL